MHVYVHDTTCLGYVEILPDESALTTVGFFERAVDWFATRGVTVCQVMGDNGLPYISRPWATWRQAHAVEHVRTLPTGPRTNGRAERLNQTLLGEMGLRQSVVVAADAWPRLPSFPACPSRPGGWKSRTSCSPTRSRRSRSGCASGTRGSDVRGVVIAPSR